MKTKITEISLFYCSNSLSSDEISALQQTISGIRLKVISLPCSGKVNLLYLLKAIETGSDGVLLAGCEMGTCKYLQGNFRAKKRIGSVDEILVEAGLEKGLVEYVSLEARDKMKMLISSLMNLAEKIKQVEVQG
jgi:coenzyme F420-reducing hydrogenase delta subunit